MRGERARLYSWPPLSSEVTLPANSVRSQLEPYHVWELDPTSERLEIHASQHRHFDPEWPRATGKTGATPPGLIA